VTASVRLRSFFLPSVAALAVTIAALNLGQWQLRRAAEKLDLERQRVAALEAGPVSLPALPLSPADAARLEGRLVTVRGCLLAGRSVFVDNRSHHGIAGFHLLTPVTINAEGSEGSRCTSGDQAAVHLLVLRGWVPRNPRDRTSLPEVIAPSGPVQLTGIVQRELPRSFDLGSAPVPAAGERIWQNPALRDYADRTGLTLLPFVLRQTAGTIGEDGPVDDGLARDWHRPGAEVDKHRGYAFQWFSLAATAVGLWGWFVLLNPWLARRHRGVGNSSGND
jgi:surfeit locus 1 family protein